MEIGDVILENSVFWPMAGVTDLPFRLICKEWAVGVYTEMISSGTILWG